MKQGRITRTKNRRIQRLVIHWHIIRGQKLPHRQDTESGALSWSNNQSLHCSS